MCRFLLLFFSFFFSYTLDAQNPNWNWVKKAGGLTDDRPFDSYVDSLSGNIYITGTFQGTVNFGNYSLLSAGMDDIFIAKYDSSGNVLWAKKAGGTGTDVSRSIVIDLYGNCYIAGTFSSSIASFGTININNAGLRDIFLARYNAINGNEEFAKSYGSNDDDGSTKLVVDENANCYFIGDFNNTVNFSGSISLTSVGAFDSFIVKSDSSFNVVWARRSGGTGSEVAYDLRFKNGYCFAAGYFQNTATFGSLPSISSSGSNDIFIVKYEANAGTEQWVKRAGGTGADMAFAIDVDIKDDIIISGFFQNTVAFGSLPSITSYGNNDIYIVKYDINGSPIWLKRAGGLGNDYSYDIDTDCQGNIYVVSTFEGSADFANSTIISAGSSDVGIAKYDPSGNLIWVEKAGGGGLDEGIGIGLDKNNYCYVSGKFSSTSTFGNLTPVNSTGNSDIFLAKLNATTSCCGTVSINLGNDTTLCAGQSLMLDAGNSGATYSWSTGEFSQEINVVNGGNYWVNVFHSPCPMITDSIEVNYIPSIDYIINNLITSNNDGKNDSFQISGLVPNTAISVYNRWGALVYNNENYLNDWKPENINEGIYFYNIFSENTCVKEYKGWLHILK